MTRPRTKCAVIYHRLKNVGRAANDDYVTPPTMSTDVIVEVGGLSSVTTSLYDIIVPGEEDKATILHGPPPKILVRTRMNGGSKRQTHVT